MWYWSEWSKLSNKAPKKVLFQLGGESVAPTCRYGTLYGHYCLLLLRFFVSSLLGHFCSDFEKYHSASWLLRFLVPRKNQALLLHCLTLKENMVIQLCTENEESAGVQLRK